MRLKPMLGTLLLLLLPLAVADAQSTTLFGYGCAGTGKGPVVGASLNDPPGSFMTNTLPNEYGFAVKAPAPMVVLGFQFWTKAVQAPTSSLAGLYLEDATAAGKPAVTSVAMGVMAAGTTLDWQTVMLDKPVQIAKDQLFWISQYETNAIHPTDLTAGGTKPGATYWRNQKGTGSWATTSILTHPAWRIIVGFGATGTGTGTPHLYYSGVPTRGQTFEIRLALAKGPAPALLFTGNSNNAWSGIPLPFDLGILGAPGCAFQVAGLLMTNTAALPDGTAKVIQPVPNLPELSGARLHHQFAIIDTGANAAGLVLSNGGTAQVGP